MSGSKGGRESLPTGCGKGEPQIRGPLVTGKFTPVARASPQGHGLGIPGSGVEARESIRSVTPEAKESGVRAEVRVRWSGISAYRPPADTAPRDLHLRPGEGAFQTDLPQRHRVPKPSHFCGLQKRSCNRVVCDTLEVRLFRALGPQWFRVPASALPSSTKTNRGRLTQAAWVIAGAATTPELEGAGVSGPALQSGS